MAYTVANLLSDLDQFIAGKPSQEEEFFRSLRNNELFDEESYTKIIEHLNSRLNTVKSDDPRYSSIHVTLALFELISPIPSDENVQAAIQRLNQAISANNFMAMCVLGYCYLKGLGVPENIAKAGELFQKAAAGGNACAAYELARGYDINGFLPENHEKAVDFYQQAIDRGHAEAANTLAFDYRRAGIPENLTKAIHLHIQAITITNSAYKADLYLTELNTSLIKYLKNLNAIRTPLSNIDFVAIARCCAHVSLRFPEAYEIAEVILTTLTEKTNNFEVLYWATRASGSGEAIVELLEKYPDEFVPCLLKDDLCTEQQKRLNLDYLLTEYSNVLSGRSVFFILHQLGELENLCNPALNPFSFFNLLPRDMINTFADNIMPKSGTPPENTAISTLSIPPVEVTCVEIIEQPNRKRKDTPYRDEDEADDQMTYTPTNRL